MTDGARVETPLRGAPARTTSNFLRKARPPDAEVEGRIVGDHRCAPDIVDELVHDFGEFRRILEMLRPNAVGGTQTVAQYEDRTVGGHRVLERDEQQADAERPGAGGS